MLDSLSIRNPILDTLLGWIVAGRDRCMSTVVADGTFPWGTKGDLNRIGDKLRASGDGITPREASVLEIWRASHYHVMNAFNVMLRRRTSGASITVARRHKRRITIIDKLYREPGMQLSRMDDVAGMRLIFPDKKRTPFISHGFS